MLCEKNAASEFSVTAEDQALAAAPVLVNARSLVNKTFTLWDFFQFPWYG